jgi:hypothetical protein
MRVAVCCLILIIASGCTGANPEFDTLNEDGIPRPTFSGAYLKQITTGDPNQTFSINGECNTKVRGINGMAVGTIGTFSSVSSLATSINVTCSSDGKFSFTMKSLTDLGYTVAEGTTYEIQLRSETSAGMSKPSSIKIYYSTTAGGTRPIRITSGGIIGGGESTVGVGTTTGVFKANIRITNQMNDMASAQSSSEDAYLKTGSAFKARVGIRNDFQ